jgi:hypothetical protein
LRESHFGQFHQIDSPNFSYFGEVTKNALIQNMFSKTVSLLRETFSNSTYKNVTCQEYAFFLIAREKNMIFLIKFSPILLMLLKK